MAVTLELMVLVSLSTLGRAMAWVRQWLTSSMTPQFTVRRADLQEK